jgi:hypothetical protein
MSHITDGRDEKYIQNFGRETWREQIIQIPRRMWEDNIKMDLREISWESVDWMHMAQDRDQWRAVVNTVMNLRVL